MIFCFDLDRTLIHSQRHLLEGVPVLTAEYRQGEAIGFITPGALEAFRGIQHRSICLVNTLRGLEQARRINFVSDGSCRYLALQNGLYLYCDGVLDADWSAHVSRTINSLPLCLEDGVSRVLKRLPGIECLSKQYEYLAVFFTRPDFDDQLCNALAMELALLGWSIFRQRKKLYLFPSHIHKGSVLERVMELEGCKESIGFGDSAFDIPFLRLCGAAWAPGGCELKGQALDFPIRFSKQTAQAGTEDVLRCILSTL